MSDEYTEVAVRNDAEWRNNLQAQIALGFDAERFLGSKLGQYLEQRAQDTALEAMQALKTCDPTDSKSITALQNAVFRAESFTYWLAACISEGENAQAKFTEQQ